MVEVERVQAVGITHLNVTTDIEKRKYLGRIDIPVSEMK
jgi:hypothetical protein